MALTADYKGKGRPRAFSEDFESGQIDQEDQRASVSDSSESDSDSGSESESDISDSSESGSEASENEELSEAFLDSLLDKARQNMSAKTQVRPSFGGEEEVIQLGSSDDFKEECVMTKLYLNVLADHC